MTEAREGAPRGGWESQALDERLHLALEASGLGTWQWSIADGTVVWDARLEELYGFEPGTFPGTFSAYRERLHPDDRDQMLAIVEEATRSRRPYRVEHRIVRPDGTIRWVQGTGQVTVGADGEVTGAIGCSLDVTALMEARLELATNAAEAEAAVERERALRHQLEFVARINEAVAEGGTRHEVMVNVTRAAVPRLGDWCLIYVLPEPGATVPEVEAAHVDPMREAEVRELAKDFGWDPGAAAGMPVVLRTGESQFHPDLSEADFARSGLSDERRALALRLGFHSVMLVPLIKRGRVIGGLQFVMAESDRRHTEDDLALAEAIAGRVASGLENRRLNDQQRLIAHTLQSTLLPDQLPEIPNLRSAVRYWAAGEGTVVGGDFYDLFAIDDHSWAAVIGDICGTGPLAASLTSLARSTIHLCAQRGDDAPTALTWLNHMMLEARPGWFLTGAYLTLRPTGGGVDVEATVAGHPFPLVVDGAGRVRAVGRPGTLLGVFEEIRLRPATDHLAPGETLVLFTDGVSDVAPPHGLDEAGVIRLVSEAVLHADGRGPEAIADEIHDRLEAILPMDDRTDDIALLLLQVPTAG